MRRALAALAVVALAPAPATAQSYQTIVETRRVNGTAPLNVDVTFAAGRLNLRPSDGRQLYRVGLKYVEDVFDPTIQYDPEARKLTVSVEGHGNTHLKDSDEWKQQLDLDLPRDVPLDLTMAFGALEADVDLGDLTLRSARFKTGASQATVAFSSPAQGSCERLDFEVGAAEFQALQLGNSGCRFVTLKGAVGSMTLDFDGARLWTGEMRATIKVGLGDVTLRVPESVGIRLDADRLFASVSRAGLHKRGSAYFSSNYDDASAKLIISVDAAFGSVDLERH